MLSDFAMSWSRSCIFIAGCIILTTTIYFAIYSNEVLETFNLSSFAPASYMFLVAHVPDAAVNKPFATANTTVKISTKASELITTNRFISNLSDNFTFLCLVMTRSISITHQEAIIKTWGSDCTDLIFLFGKQNITDSYLQERNLHIYNLSLNVSDEYDNTWMKIRTALIFVNNTWTKKFDWIIRIDDDAYLIFENLKTLLAPHPATIPIQFGCHLLRYLGGYIQTGPGIVLSHSAFQSLMNIFYNNSLCDTYSRTHNDDVELGKCLKSAGVPFGDSSDRGVPYNRPKFIMSNLYELVHTPKIGTATFFRTESAYSVGDGFDCCAEDLIGLHYLKAADIRHIYDIIRSNPDERKSARLLAP